jgi:hypothetical protein
VEAKCFAENPMAYLSGTCTTTPSLSDVYATRVGGKQFCLVVLKVMSHWIFNVLGRLINSRIKQLKITKYRKGYVDDIELVFEKSEPGVVRAIYPFPINLKRQIRFLAYLRREGYFFKVDGNPYGIVDFLKFIVERNIGSLRSLESRAQIRQARAVAKLGVTVVQLSDEFDIGSLDFSQCLRRNKIIVVNSAHGVGKYFPVHAYQEFHVLTAKQQRYYRGIGDCAYKLRRLNDNSLSHKLQGDVPTSPRSREIKLVLLSQTFGGADDLIAKNEATLIEFLREEFSDGGGVKLFYKPHPNRKNLRAVEGFELLADIKPVNDCDSTIYISFFSTCQIDPAFKGRKYLVRGHLIYPEIAFDDMDTIKTRTEIACLIRLRLRELGSR